MNGIHAGAQTGSGGLTQVVKWVTRKSRSRLPAVAVPLEVEPQLEDVVVEVAAEAALVRVLPLAVDDLEGDVLVGRARVEAQHREVWVLRTRFLK